MEARQLQRPSRRNHVRQRPAPTTPATPTQNVNTGTKSQPESNGAGRNDTTPILRLLSLVITPQQRLRMEQNRLRALKIRQRRQMKQNRDTQNRNSKEKGQAKTNSASDTEDGTNEASDDKVRSIQAAGAESGSQQLIGIKPKHSNTMKRANATEGKVNTVNNQWEQSTSKRTTPGKCFV